MPILQQIQSIPSHAQVLSRSAARPYIISGIVILLETIALVAGPVFALCVTTVVLIGLAYYLKDRKITKLVAATLTVMLIALSAAALFPAYSVIAFGTAAAITGCCFAYILFKIVKSSPARTSQV